MDPLIDHMKATFRRQQDAFQRHPYPSLSDRKPAASEPSPAARSAA